MENKDKAKITTVTAAFIHRDDTEEANCRVVEFMIEEITIRHNNNIWQQGTQISG